MTHSILAYAEVVPHKNRNATKKSFKKCPSFGNFFVWCDFYKMHMCLLKYILKYSNNVLCYAWQLIRVRRFLQEATFPGFTISTMQTWVPVSNESGTLLISSLSNGGFKSLRQFKGTLIVLFLCAFYYRS